MHQLGLRLFGTMVWKLLIIESFFQSKLNTIKNYIRIWGHFSCCLKTFGKSNLIFYFTIFKTPCKILVFEWILLQEIQTICNNLVSKEKYVALNVFTLGPTSQATLVILE